MASQQCHGELCLRYANVPTCPRSDLSLSWLFKPFSLWFLIQYESDLQRLVFLPTALGNTW
jgi:hypothetical protein